MSESRRRWLPLVVAALLPAAVASAAVAPIDPVTLDRLAADSGGSARIGLQRATGAARFVSVDPGSLPIDRVLPVEQQAAVFFATYGGAFGIASPADELVLVDSRADALGGTRLSYEQRHQGVPVFAGWLRVHFDAQDRLKVVNGTFVPGIEMGVEPRWDAAAAGAVALADLGGRARIDLLAPPVVGGVRLMVWRQGLVRGVPGPDHLVWEVEVGDGNQLGERIYVDAGTGKVVERIERVHDALNRRAFNSEANYPATPFWVEGNPFPTGNTEADNVIRGTGESYDVFFHTFGWDSWDGAGSVMDGVFNRTTSCPNASWNGVFTSYCPGVSGDDTVAHEWGHAFTDGTHDLIYQWQPGALNESYSDMWGEVVDIINARGTDTPDKLRAAGACSTLGGSPAPRMTINSPAPIADDYAAGGAAFNPAPPRLVTANLALVADGTAPASDGCQSLVGFPAGRIAVIDRGTCTFVIKVQNAQAAGASGVIVVNDQGDGVITMGGADPANVTPAVMIGQSDGDLIKAQLGGTVNGTIELAVSTDPSIRWLSGEDDPSFGGAIRDLWNPPCFGNPGKVTDVGQYGCTTADGGGVHNNSGVPNHAFALMVDGGTYNGETVTRLGLAKTASIVWRAQSVYQGPSTDFADHADALEQSCADLTGTAAPNPYGKIIFADGFEHGDTASWASLTITGADCAEVGDAIDAVEFRTEPTFCAFQPMLDPNTPVLCSGASAISTTDFEAGLGSWTVSRRGVGSPGTFDNRDWSVVGSLPGGRPGMAAFGPDPNVGDCAGDNEHGALVLESPTIVIPGGADPRLRFDHWVATEPLWDGGNVKISINGGGYTVIPALAFSFNPYNTAALNASGNPLGGEPAFSGADGGSVLGSWGQSQIDLTGIASPGDSIKLRFEMGTDECAGAFGWYVDDVVVYDCP
jgi:Zn-dependent metalloprotease